MWSPCFGAHRFSDREDTTARRNGLSAADSRRRRERHPRRLATVTPYLSQWRPTLESASGESWGRLARTIAADRPNDPAPRPAWRLLGRRIRDREEAQPLPDAPDHPHRGRPPRRATRRSRRAGRRPARTPVRGVQGDGRPRPRREGRPLPDRRRPVRLRTSSRAARSSASPPSSSAWPTPGSGRSSSRAPTTVYDRASIYRAYDLAALAGAPARRRLVTVLDPDHPVGPPAGLDVVVHGPVFATKRAPHSPLAGHRRTAGGAT